MISSPQNQNLHAMFIYSYLLGQGLSVSPSILKGGIFWHEHSSGAALNAPQDKNYCCSNVLKIEIVLLNNRPNHDVE